MTRVMLEGPQPCTIFCFAFLHCMSCITKTFLLASSLISCKQLLCFEHSQGQKRGQKHATKNFLEFHNHSPLLTLPAVWTTSNLSHGKAS